MTKLSRGLEQNPFGQYYCPPAEEGNYIPHFGLLVDIIEGELQLIFEDDFPNTYITYFIEMIKPELVGACSPRSLDKIFAMIEKELYRLHRIGCLYKSPITGMWVLNV